MGNSYTRNDTGNNIADANIIDAADLDGEFDALEDAFDGSAGHTHDGTTGEGGPITLVGPSQEVVITSTTVEPATTNSVDLGTATKKYKDVHVQGTINAGALALTTDLPITEGGTGSSTASAARTALGVEIGADVQAWDADLDTYAANPLSAGELSQLQNIGASVITSADWTKVASIDTMATQNSTSVNIDGGAIDGTIIGGTTRAAASFTTINVNGIATLADAQITDGDASFTTLSSGSVNIDGGNIDGTVIGNASVANGNFAAISTTGVATLASAQISGGDASFTTLFAGSANIDGGNIDATVIGAGTPAAASFTNINTTSSIVTSNNDPRIDLVESDGTSTHNRTSFTISSDTFLLQTRNSAGTLVSSDYGIFKDASGATAHQWNLAGAGAAKLDSTGLGIGTTSPSEKLDVNSDGIRVRSPQTPASAAATGDVGQICWDGNYIYVCVSANTWKRASLATW